MTSIYSPVPQLGPSVVPTFPKNAGELRARAYTPNSTTLPTVTTLTLRPNGNASTMANNISLGTTSNPTHDPIGKSNDATSTTVVPKQGRERSSSNPKLDCVKTSEPIHPPASSVKAVLEPDTQPRKAKTVPQVVTIARPDGRLVRVLTPKSLTTLDTQPPPASPKAKATAEVYPCASPPMPTVVCKDPTFPVLDNRIECNTGDLFADTPISSLKRKTDISNDQEPPPASIQVQDVQISKRRKTKLASKPMYVGDTVMLMMPRDPAAWEEEDESEEVDPSVSITKEEAMDLFRYMPMDEIAAFFKRLGPADRSAIEDLVNHLLNTPRTKSEEELMEEAIANLNMSLALICDGDCTQCGCWKKPRYKVSQNDPLLNKSLDSTWVANVSTLGQAVSSQEGQHHHMFQGNMFNECSLSVFKPRSTSEQSVTRDIETVTDSPRQADSSSSSSCSSSPFPSSNLCRSSLPTTQPIQNINLNQTLSISAPTSRTSVLETSLLRQNSIDDSSSTSLDENLVAVGNHSFSSTPHKEREHSTSASPSSSSVSSASSFSSVPSLVNHQVEHSDVNNNNSLNFHDYAMSSGSCAAPSTETAQPTVLEERMFRKRLVYSAEKQLHSNLLERKRRREVSDLFRDLRDLVPKIRGQCKASKATIMNAAKYYKIELQRLDQRQECEKKVLAQTQLMLRKQLNGLQA